LRPREIEQEFCLLSESEREVYFSDKDLIELMQAVFAKGASLRLKVTGFSMWPFIKDNDVVTISGLNNFSIDFGRAVAFVHSRANKLVMHRIVGRNNGFYLLKGDNTFDPDGLVPKENILGCLTKIERNDKSISFGLGRERSIIALFNRVRLWYFVLRFWRLLSLGSRNSIKPII